MNRLGFSPPQHPRIVVGQKRDRRTRKWSNDRRNDNEGDDDDNNDNNKASRSSPIPNRFLDGDGDVGVTIVTTMIGEEDKHGPGDASVAIENYKDKDNTKDHRDKSNLLPPLP